MSRSTPVSWPTVSPGWRSGSLESWLYQGRFFQPLSERVLGDPKGRQMTELGVSFFEACRESLQLSGKSRTARTRSSADRQGLVE